MSPMRVRVRVRVRVSVRVRVRVRVRLTLSVVACSDGVTGSYVVTLAGLNYCVLFLP